MQLFITILVWIGRVAWLGAITLGLLHWIFRISFLPIHWLFGFTLTLTLLIMSIMALFKRGGRVIGIIGILFAPIIPVFGFSQTIMLVGDFHWLIQVAHLLVGVAAGALVDMAARPYLQRAVPAKA